MPQLTVGNVIALLVLMVAIVGAIVGLPEIAVMILIAALAVAKLVP